MTGRMPGLLCARDATSADGKARIALAADVARELPALLEADVLSPAAMRIGA
jgi:hypothetical protein